MHDCDRGTGIVQHVFQRRSLQRRIHGHINRTERIGRKHHPQRERTCLQQQYDVIVLADEVYDRILFNGAEHVSIATLPGMWERTLTINSTGKTFSMTGWKIGYAIGSASLNAASCRAPPERSQDANLSL